MRLVPLGQKIGFPLPGKADLRLARMLDQAIALQCQLEVSQRIAERPAGQTSLGSSPAVDFPRAFGDAP